MPPQAEEITVEKTKGGYSVLIWDEYGECEPVRVHSKAAAKIVIQGARKSACRRVKVVWLN